MDDFEHYRCRHIFLKQSDEKSKQAEAACHKVAGIEGIILATPVDILNIHLIYSLDHFSFELIIELLDELGFECDNSIMLSLRNAIYQYLDENARENLDIDITRFDQKSPNNQKIPHQPPNKYWEDYH